MAKAGFYNDNEYRDYPFITRVASNDAAADAGFPQAAIVDFGAIINTGIAYDAQQHAIYLHAVRRDASTVEFEFRLLHPATTETVRFSRELTDAPYLTEWQDSAAYGSSQSLAVADEAAWTAFLVTGHLDALAAIMPSGSTWTFAPTQLVIEPARIQALTYLRAIHLANRQRTQVTLPARCETPTTPDASAVAVGSVTGIVRFREGYNCTIRQDASRNAIIVGARVGAGAGRPCNEVPRYPGESSPDGGRYLTGGPACDEVVTTINGVGGRNFQLTAGRGIRISPDPDRTDTLIIQPDFSDFALCLNQPDATIAVPVLEGCDFEALPKFDFGPATSDVPYGWTRVSRESAYDATQGYGWITPPVADIDRGRLHMAIDARYEAPSNVLRDFAAVAVDADAVFRVDVPRGIYAIRLYAGDVAMASAGWCTVNEAPAVQWNQAVGTFLLTIPDSYFAAPDGYLDLLFHGTGDVGAAINGVELCYVADLPSESSTSSAA